MDRLSTAQAATMPVEFTLNGRSVVGRSDETIIQTAERYGIDIPHLCYKEGLRPDGNCRACVVEIKGERVLAPSCCRTPKGGMEVDDSTARARVQPEDGAGAAALRHARASYTRDSELDHWAKELDVGKPRFAARHQPKADLSHPAIAVNLDACIQCTRCVPCLPRGAGQRRDRLRFPRRALEDRVRFRRPDGRVHLRGLRRVRAGLPDRRTHAGARRRDGQADKTVDRSARIAAWAANSPTTSRTTRSSACRDATGPRITAVCA